MIIDVHTHIFPPDVIGRREMYLKRDISFCSIYENPKARMVTTDQLIEEMDSSGIDMAVVCGFPWKSLDLCRFHNNYMIEAVSKYPGRLIGLAMVNPLAGKACDNELERCFQNGLSGVGELSADMQGFNLDDSTTMGRIVGAVDEAGLFILVHVNE
ncbi:MAG: amidohydrolase family protein, partial [Actinobacteria bacterium]|nr:amidohydrolase family protein [Actinomycetota bacterium]